eukprot:Platyproteum_vivax@DN2083_c0_g1_i1.p1
MDKMDFIRCPPVRFLPAPKHSSQGNMPPPPPCFNGNMPPPPPPQAWNMGRPFHSQFRPPSFRPQSFKREVPWRGAPANKSARMGSPYVKPDMFIDPWLGLIDKYNATAAKKIERMDCTVHKQPDTAKQPASETSTTMENVSASDANNDEKQLGESLTNVGTNESNDSTETNFKNQSFSVGYLDDASLETNSFTTLAGQNDTPKEAGQNVSLLGALQANPPKGGNNSFLDALKAAPPKQGKSEE